MQVAQFISKLNQSRLLKDVNLLISDEFLQGTDKVRKFEASRAVRGSAMQPQIVASSASSVGHERCYNNWQ